MTVLKGIRLQIYPNAIQRNHISQNIGNNRFVWNELLNMSIERYKNNPSLPPLSAYDYSNLLPTLKMEYPFLKEGDASSLQVVCDELRKAYMQFFKKTHGFPKFKTKRKSKKSYTMKFTNNNIELESNRIRLPKLGWISANWSSDLKYTKIRRVAITHLPTGEYIASVLVDSEKQTFAKTDMAVGIDLGMSDLIVGSNGLRIDSHSYSDLEESLRKWQRTMARRARSAKSRGVELEDSKNYQAAKRTTAKYYQKIANSRKDYNHKITTQLVKDYDIIVVEDLNIEDMIRNPDFNKHMRGFRHNLIAQGWGQIITMLEYKCEWYGKTLIKVNPRYTTQDCSSCGARTGPKGQLSVRNWICSICNVSHDRDINAANNILQRGLRDIQSIQMDTQ